MLLVKRKSAIGKILTHLNVYEENKDQCAPPIARRDYTDPIEIVPYDVGWSGYEEPVFDF